MAQPFQKARWIWLPGEPLPNQYADFAARFAARPETGALLRVSADSNYSLRLNGALVFAGQYADFPYYKVYDEIDCAPFLREGENELEITAYCALTDSSVYRRGEPGLIFEIVDGAGEALCISGEATRCRPNAHYAAGPVDLITGQLGYTFDCDANRPEHPWAAPAVKRGAAQYTPRPVKRPQILPRMAGTVVAQGLWRAAEGAESVGQRMQYAYLSSRALVPPRAALPDEAGLTVHGAPGEGVYLLIDLGREEAGFLDIDLAVDAPCEVLIGWGEHTDDMRLRTYVGGRNFASRYVAKAGRQRFTHTLRRAGLRYVELLIAAARATVYYAGLLPTVYPLNRAGEMRLPDPLNRRIYETCLHTLQTCMHEHYEDCPWREQALYTMDSRNQMLAGYYAFAEYDFARASMRLMAFSLREDGLLELCAPARVAVTIPSFSAMFCVQLWEYLLFSGDYCFAKEMQSVAQSIADAFLARRADNGLIPAYRREPYWDFYEWRPLLDGMTFSEADKAGPRFDAPLNLFAVLALQSLAKILDALDVRLKAAYYRDCAALLRDGVKRMFYDEGEGLYYSFVNARARWGRDELTQALAVCAGEPGPKAIEALAGGKLTPVTLSHTVFKYDALLTEPDRYADWVFRDVEGQWGEMLYHGATTFWETGAGGWDFENAGSLCHGWSAVPAYLYYAYALGLKPSEPGFQKYAVKPVASGLAGISGAVRTRDGRKIELGETNG